MFPGDAGAMERDRSPADCKKGSSSITSWSIKCEKQADKKKRGGGADNTKGVMGWSGARAGRGADVAAVPDVRSSS